MSTRPSSRRWRASPRRARRSASPPSPTARESRSTRWSRYRTERSARPRRALAAEHLAREHDQVVERAPSRRVGGACAGDQAQLAARRLPVHAIGGKLGLGVLLRAGDLEGRLDAVLAEPAHAVPRAEPAQLVEDGRRGRRVGVARENGGPALPGLRATFPYADLAVVLGHLERAVVVEPEVDHMCLDADLRNLEAGARYGPSRASGLRRAGAGVAARPRARLLAGEPDGEPGGEHESDHDRRPRQAAPQCDPHAEVPAARALSSGGPAAGR